MKTSDLAEAIAAKHGLSDFAARAVVDSVLAAIVDAAVRGEDSNLVGFGKFKVQTRPERIGRNPATGETIRIATSRRLTFQPSGSIKDRLNP